MAFPPVNPLSPINESNPKNPKYLCLLYSTLSPPNKYL